MLDLAGITTFLNSPHFHYSNPKTTFCNESSLLSWPFQQTRVALSFKTSCIFDLKSKKILFAHLPCLSVWNPTEVFHTMLRKILRCPNEIELILFPVAPGNKLTIHFPTDFETINNLNLGCSAGREILMNSGFGFSDY